ncbi:carboxypeptidase-like regulatory domain-containing protein [Maribacter aestuarii]|uniref:carboxypeptidase-like regulatory domain-containing protein n=1 Tax=Maribacter aestuarii TaxID=1130723 RepID=UPI0025A51EB0|nr:carboxypeptidase-like regulatory domain-containing protein [Maribacter aestuarii]
MMLRTNIWIVFIFCAAWLSAQQDEFFLGKIEDSSTGEPVVFANIRIKDRALGIITNVDGSFRIPLRYKEYGDIIEISSMGYETKEIPITGFSQEGLNIITLNPSAISLQEAVVKAKDKRGRRLSAEQIVQRAIDAIPSNYPKTSFSTIGYYRDYQFNEGEYINLNEGIMEVYDQGFDQSDDPTSEIQVFNFELNKDFKQDTMARMSYDYDNYKKIIRKAYLGAHGGNEFRILRIHDAIRNYNAFSYDYIGTLKYDFIENHTFLRSKDSDADNEALYGIKFWRRYPNYRAHGEIFIAKSDYAIHRLEYTMYNNRRTNKEKKKTNTDINKK